MTPTLNAAPIERPRSVERLIQGQAVMDGAGVKISRVLTQSLQRRLDPFLMLDAFGSEQPGDYIAGFPEHPHRGFETISYMITGRMRHKDSAGHEGLITDGGVQWMTAGRGVIHSEMPEQSAGLMEGFQLWLNLPAKDKMAAPWYRDIESADIPRFASAGGAQVQVIAGGSHGVTGAVERAGTEPIYLDIDLAPGASLEQALPPGHNAFLYVYRGEVTVEGKAVTRGKMAILTNPAGSDGVRIKSDQGSRLLLLAGRPLNEPIAQHGPFVMNTQAELVAAFEDFRAGRFAT
jgi:redox-sensitive bicupin YhaK (pirin superfamily)